MKKQKKKGMIMSKIKMCGTCNTPLLKEELPENFQKSEHVQDCGFVDAIIHRKDLPEKIGILLSILLKKQSEVKIEHGDKTSEDNIENREAS